MNPIGLIVLIIAINIVYVSLFTVRIMFVMKGRRLLASAVSVIEVFTYLIGLNMVLSSIDQPLNLAAYCLGWGSGVYLGSRIEEWLALGYVTVQIIVDHTKSELPSVLRAKGYGVTCWTAEGRDGLRMVMNVLTKRSNEKMLLNTLEELAPKAFVISHEPRLLRGGFWTRRLH